MSYFDIGPIKKVSFVDKFTGDEVLNLDNAWATTNTINSPNQFYDEDMLNYLLSGIMNEKAKEAEKILEQKIINKKKTKIDALRINIKEVIFNDPAVIIKWKDGTKTVVKCQKGEKFDPEKGLALALVKYLMGNIGYYNTIFKDWID